MNKPVEPEEYAQQIDMGLCALCTIAAYYRIAADPRNLQRELALGGRAAESDDVTRAAKFIGLKARRNVLTLRGKAINKIVKTLNAIPTPAIVRLFDGTFNLFGGRLPSGFYRLIDPITRIDRELSAEDLVEEIEPEVILVARRVGGQGVDPHGFGFRWFLPSIWRYRRPLGQVLLASFFIQLFALVTPLFFQVIIDKVLTHKSYDTLFVFIGGLAIIGLFDVVLQYLRTYALTHTTNRIDVELGRRLFHHLIRLPLLYFETRSAGQTVARVRELETIRNFLTGQGLFSAIDLLFTFAFIGVLLIYSWKLSFVVILSIPFYIATGALIRPVLREMIKDKFNKGAESQQFLVEAIVGAQTIKAAAVEPVMQVQWEDKLAAYVRSSFDTGLLAAKGQNAIQYVSKLSNAALLLFGAKLVIDGELTLGELIAFNMIAAQVAQPILRLSQLWQDFQQIQISVDRLGDILNVPIERAPLAQVVLPPPRGAFEFRNVTFRYRPNMPDVLKNISLKIAPGETLGVVGPSGSGKSTLTKLIQRFYVPEEGQVLLDGIDLSQADPSWLRGNIGVVLQENLLFNRTIHDNIALANPAIPRAQVMAVARLAGADEFISKLPQGYDTMIEERGTNLSGGQRQRIAIARALATNPPILIFDEATSALDYESERAIHANMREIARNRTVIVIAHRLAAVRQCNFIIGVKDGRIVEAGTHETLLQQQGLYARLWAIQNDQAVD